MRAGRLLERKDEVRGTRELQIEKRVRRGAEAVTVQVLRRIAGERQRVEQAPGVELHFASGDGAYQTIAPAVAKRRDERSEQRPADDVEHGVCALRWRRRSATLERDDVRSRGTREEE